MTSLNSLTSRIKQISPKSSYPNVSLQLYKENIASLQKRQKLYSFRESYITYEKYSNIPSLEKIMRDKIIKTLDNSSSRVKKSNPKIKYFSNSHLRNMHLGKNRILECSKVNIKMSKANIDKIIKETSAKTDKRIKILKMPIDLLSKTKTSGNSSKEKYNRNGINSIKKLAITEEASNKQTQKMYYNPRSKRVIPSNMKLQSSSPKCCNNNHISSSNKSNTTNNITNNNTNNTNSLSHFKTKQNSRITKIVNYKTKASLKLINIKKTKDNSNSKQESHKKKKIKINKDNVIKIMYNKNYNDYLKNKIIKNSKSNKNSKNNNKIQKGKNIKINEDSFIYLQNKDCFLHINENLTKSNIQKNTEKSNIINSIRKNDYNVKKPKEENLKYTLLKNKNDKEVNEEINKSKVIIGPIEGYQDIIEDDILNNDFFQKENTIRRKEPNTADNSNPNKKKNNRILLNFHLKEIKEEKAKEKNQKINNNDTSEIKNNNYNSGSLFSESEIKSILNYVNNDNDTNDLSPFKPKKKRIYNNKNLLPCHENKISFVKKNSNKKGKYIIKNKYKAKNMLLVNGEKISININQNKNKIVINKIKNIKKEESTKNKSNYNINYKNKNKSKKDFVVQNISNVNIQGTDKKCTIF